MADKPYNKKVIPRTLENHLIRLRMDDMQKKRKVDNIGVKGLVRQRMAINNYEPYSSRAQQEFFKQLDIDITALIAKCTNPGMFEILIKMYEKSNHYISENMRKRRASDTKEERNV